MMLDKFFGDLIMNLEKCNVCPRQCGVDRTSDIGFCGQSNEIKIARSELHFWEEPCISGVNGSGTIFFSGCSLRCIFCQNHVISTNNKGYYISSKRLAELILSLQEKGAHNINLVNPTHFTPQICDVLREIKPVLQIPVVYNCGGYERVEALNSLEGLVDIFIPDLKYISSEISYNLSHAKDYFDYASKAIRRMIEITGKPKFDKNLLVSGTIIRHLVLPGYRQNSIDIVNWLKQNLKKESYLLSLMSQYTPIRNDFSIKSLNRRLSTFEYNQVLKCFEENDFIGFIQDFSSSSDVYIPDFYDKDRYIQNAQNN